MSEEEFLNCTPKKINALYKIYKQVEGIEDENNKAGYIDDVIF